MRPGDVILIIHHSCYTSCSILLSYQASADWLVYYSCTLSLVPFSQFYRSLQTSHLCGPSWNHRQLGNIGFLLSMHILSIDCYRTLTAEVTEKDTL